MAKVIAALLSLGLVAGAAFAADNPDLAAEKPNLTTELGKVGYSVGYQVGSDFRKQGIALDPEMLVRGAQDALSGAEPRMTPEEMRQTLTDLQRKIAVQL
jgi:FKBP-type peptidyl-prolyl cis-trans isomerase FklB